jgi:hypothetical protein
MHHMTTSIDKRIRLTISITPEVHTAFVRLSAASGMSISRAMGEWLGDTLDAVQFTAEKVEQARAAPKLVMQEMHAYALGLADETRAVLANAREGAAAAREKGRSPSRAVAAPSPPSSNTGGKGHPTNKKKGSAR